MATPPVNNSTSGNSANNKLNTSLNGLDMDHFFKLMIAELQNQDPLNPMDNAAMLQQISLIRQVGATDQLNTTLSSVLMGQSLNNATSLLGTYINGLSDKNTEVTGLVDSVSLVEGAAKLHIGEDVVSLSNVRDVTIPF